MLLAHVDRVRNLRCATGATNRNTEEITVMRDFSNDLTEVRRRVDEASVYLKVEASRARIAELEIEVARPDLWDDQENAKKVNSEYSNLKSDLDEFASLAGSVEDLEVLHEMAREIDDESQEPDLERGISQARTKLDALELRSLFTGVHDEANAIVQINAKDGGVDAQDWSEMLLRMFVRWAERKGFEIEIGDVSEGTEAGILSADFTVRGRYAYGLLTSERGTHRLVRISPFDNQGRRQTSFANVQIWPVLEEVDVEINEADIRMEVFRASGAGGQHVNKTSSAVRLIHEPTGLVASSQQERSQLQNRENALKRLKTMVASRIEEERENELRSIGGKQAQVGWGSQIRSYVMQPYQMVKDVRTEIESGNIAGVLDGDLDSFMEGFLRWRRANSDS
jgi:peptide chain release factor 2